LTLAAPDLSSPEANLAGYIDSLRAGSTEGVRLRHVRGFKVRRPIPIISYEIKEKFVFNQSDFDSGDALPPERIGDVRLDVLQAKPDETGMYTYVFRNIEGRWMMTSHAAWGAP